MHAAIVAVKEIWVSYYYAEKESWSYFARCSTGGRQGWVEAQMFPFDFNDVLAGASVIGQTKLEGRTLFTWANNSSAVWTLQESLLTGSFRHFQHFQI